MREHYGLDRLVEYGTELIPESLEIVNPQWRRLDSQIRSKTGQRYRLSAEFGAVALSEGLSENEVQSYEQRKGQLQEQIQHLDVEIEDLKQQRKQTAHHVPIKSLPEEERFTRLRTERKHFIDTIKMIAYRAETSLVSLLREHLARSDDARTLIRQIFETEADLLPDLNAKTFTFRIPPHASGSRPGSRKALLRAQRNPNGFSGYRPDAIFQNWLILNSLRSGGLKLVTP